MIKVVPLQTLSSVAREKKINAQDLFIFSRALSEKETTSV